jgi:DNA polymerase-3 subunit delta'
MIFGHKEQIEFLKKLVRSGGISHALLFVGPEEVGKKIVALSLIKTILCKSQPDKLGGCEECDPCREFDMLIHPDLFFIKGEPGITIGEVRALKRFFSLKPSRGDKKLALINNAHLMNAEASNALLKLLEEPPGSGFVILVTSQKERILPTILSRVTPLFFNFLSNEDMAEFAKRSLTKYKSSDLMWANGRPGRLWKLTRDKSYSDALNSLRNKFRGIFTDQKIVSWEDLSDFEGMSLASKLDFLIEVAGQELMKQASKGNEKAIMEKSELIREIFIRKRSLAYYNLNERIVWDSLMLYV